MRKDAWKAGAAQRVADGCISWIEFYGLKIEKDCNARNPFGDALVFLAAKRLQQVNFAYRWPSPNNWVKSVLLNGCGNLTLLCLSEMMKTVTNKSGRRKILYVPGIISAVLLPVVLYLFAEKKAGELSVTAISFNYIDTTRVHYEYCLPKRNYTNIIFNGNVYDDRIKLDYAQIMIREIITGNDAANALHFVFTNNSHYGMVVGLLDKLRIEDAKYYFLYNKDAWFFHRQLEEAKPLEYECFLCDDVVVVQPETSWWMETKEKLRCTWSSSWQIIVLFFCFIVAVLLLKLKKKTD